MKKKIIKMLGVAVTLSLVLSFVLAGLPASGAVEKLNEWYKFAYPEEGADGDWFRQGTLADGEYINGMRELTQAINGDLYVYVSLEEGGESTEHHEIFKSTDGGRTWALTDYSVDIDRDPDPVDVIPPGRVFDMVCSSIDEDIVYATDGCYVYKTDDGGDTWDFVGKDSLEEALVGECGIDVCCDDWRVITCLDVAYDADDNPFVFIGTRGHEVCYGTGWVDGDVYYIGEAGYPANWTSLNLACYGDYDVFAIGCAPNWADSKETYAVVSDGDDETHVVYTKGTVCGWFEFAELLRDCEDPFDIWAASRIGFPDDWEDTETLFVGVTASPPCTDDFGGYGGDVYIVWQDWAQDANVAGITTGCVGKEDVDIISLDVCGDTESAALIAGAFCDTNVYYSTDGGWSWAVSAKDPTGEKWTYVIWYGDCAESALAATWGCEAAVSMTCTSDDVEDVGEAWNQISLIATDIDMVRWLGFSPGYVCEDTETMYMVTYSGIEPCDDTTSVFRNDGTYWERVFLAEDKGDYGAYEAEASEWWILEVSPDFNDTNCVYLANRYGPGIEIFRTTDAGCSWTKLTFPCYDGDDELWAMVVIDEDTVVAGVEDDGTCEVWKTTRHGARPWQEYDLPEGVCCVNDFALEPGYEDPGSILLGDECGHVCISEDGGETWELVGDFAGLLDGADHYHTWVEFDPGYAINKFIYAAAGDVIARCVIDPDLDWADQEWEEIVCQDGLYEAYGIAAVGDTALYVVDADNVSYDGLIYNGGVLRSLNPDAEDVDDVVFERIGPGLNENTELRRLWITCDTSDEGCAETLLWSTERKGAEGDDNVWVYEDTLAQPVVLDTPVEGQKLTTTDKATLSWKALCGADCYEVALWSYCPECPDEKLTVPLCLDCEPEDDILACGTITYSVDPECPKLYPCTTDICIVVDGLDSGTTYYWQVRVCQGKPTLSKWSEERSFTTALLAVPWAPCSPPCGAQDVILTPNFSWEAVPGATGYEVQVATTETFTAGVIKGKSTVNAWVAPAPFEYATTYYWRVRAEKDGIYSDWMVCMFTTMAEPVPPTPPVVVKQIPPAAPPTINIPPAEMITPTWIYAIIGVGAALAIVVIVLIVRTRRPPA